MRPAHRLLSVCLACHLFLPAALHAYRPYVTSNAAIAAPGHPTLELSHFTLVRSGGRTAAIAPDLAVSWALSRSWQLSGGFGLQLYSDGLHGGPQLLYPALLAQGILREGVLQKKPGPSLSLLATALIPSTITGEPRLGWNLTGALSASLGPLLCHGNLRLQYERTGAGPDCIWGAVAEYPPEAPLRAGFELTGITGSSASSQVIGQAAVIYTFGPIALDLAFSSPLPDGIYDWTITNGVTITF